MIAWLLALGAVLALGLLNREAWGCLPILSRALIRVGTACLRPERRDIRREEFQGELEAKYDDRRLAGLGWTICLLPLCIWERATATADHSLLRLNRGSEDSVATVELLDLEDRERVLVLCASKRAMNIEGDVLFEIARVTRSSSSRQQLEAALTHVHAVASLADKPLTLGAVRRLLRDLGY